MFEELYQVLFNGASLDVGKFFWYILKAGTEVEKMNGHFGDVDKDKVEDFKAELKGDEIWWWVSKRENDLKIFLEKSKQAKIAAQKLKEVSNPFKDTINWGGITELKPAISLIIGKIKKFTEDCKDNIGTLLDYVKWLHERDVLAPSILFTYRVWGSTRLADRARRIIADSIDDDINNVKICSLIALGLVDRFGYVISPALYIPDHGPQIIDYPEDDKRFVIKANIMVFRELATFFEFIRNSLNNIVLDAEKYQKELLILYDEGFWIKFIKKALQDTENKLWDFKQTLDMWMVDKSLKPKKQVVFCERVAAFANAKGGVFIVGITDKIPRKVVGLPDMENKKQLIGKALQKWIKYEDDFWFLKEIKLKNNNGIDCDCLIISIKQTRGVVGVETESGYYSYPRRVETGLERNDKDKIIQKKIGVYIDNFDFLLEL